MLRLISPLVPGICTCLEDSECSARTRHIVCCDGCEPTLRSAHWIYRGCCHAAHLLGADSPCRAAADAHAKKVGIASQSRLEAALCESSEGVEIAPGCPENKTFADRGFGGSSATLLGGCLYASPLQNLCEFHRKSMGNAGRRWTLVGVQKGSLPELPDARGIYSQITRFGKWPVKFREFWIVQGLGKSDPLPATHKRCLQGSQSPWALP